MRQLIFSCPVDCLAGVGEVWGGQYNLPSGCSISGVPSVLDIGANCGAFSLWARTMWPGCRVTAYEPQPDIFAHLYQNLAQVPNTEAINAAVGDPEQTWLFRGQDSRLCTSQYDLGEQSTDALHVQVIAPDLLPRADIIKIDAEGAEGYIVEHLSYTPAALLLEWHGAENRRRVEIALAGKMVLASVRCLSISTGICCYLKP